MNQDDVPDLDASLFEPLEEDTDAQASPPDPATAGADRRSAPSVSGAMPAVKGPAPPSRPTGPHASLLNTPAAWGSGHFPQPTASPASPSPPSASGQFPTARPLSPSGQFQRPVPGAGAPSSTGQFPATPAPSGSGAGSSPPANPSLGPLSGRFPQPPRDAQRPPPVTGQFQVGTAGGDAGGDFAEAVTSFHQMPDAPPAPKKSRRGVISAGTAVFIGAIAATIAGYLCVTRWLEPAEAVVWMGLGTLLPSILAGLLLAVPNRETMTPKLFITGIAPALVVTVGATLIAGLWASGNVRASVVAFAPSEPGIYERILRDPDGVVAVAGCRQIASYHESPQWRPLLMSVLTLRPAMAVECLRDLDAAAQTSLAQSLADRWTRQLGADVEEGTRDEERTCSTAGAMAQLPLERGEVNARLLHCAIAAPSTQAQDCCGQALASAVADPNQWVNHIRETIGYIHDDRTAMGVFSLAFHQKNLNATQKKFASSVNFQGANAQIVALQFACDTILAGKLGVVAHIDATLEGECPVESGQLPGGRAVWAEVCARALLELESYPESGEPEVVLCESTRDVLFESATDVARQMVGLAISKDTQSNLAKSIDSGYDHLVNDIAANRADDTNYGWVDQDDVHSARYEPTKQYFQSEEFRKRNKDIPPSKFIWDPERNSIRPNPDK